jgi:Domain of unknown function DUF29
MSDLYDTDILLWSEQQAGLLRRLAAGEHINDSADWQNIAEEIEALGKSQARELASRIATVLEHLIKLEASPAADPRAGWRSTIRRERREIERLLADAPSLRPTVSAVIERELASAREAVRDDLADRREQPRLDMATLSYTAEQALGTWLPD